MRRVFSSARIENAEAVARMLQAEGIEVRIENGRSFRKGIRGNFSYRNPGNPADNPSVWVIRSDDQPLARQLLRDAGLLDDGAAAASRSYLPNTAHGGRDQDVALARRRSRRMRLMLLAGVAIVAAAIIFKPRPDQPWQPAARQPAPVATPLDPSLDAIDTVVGSMYLIAPPPALAAEVARRELVDRDTGTVCLAIEGEDPPEATLAALQAGGVSVMAASACHADDAFRVDVHAWRTDGSGRGEVTWSAGHGTAPAVTRTRVAERDGDAWHLEDTP